jgi:hypothetical protein
METLIYEPLWNRVPDNGYENGNGRVQCHGSDHEVLFPVVIYNLQELQIK